MRWGVLLPTFDPLGTGAPPPVAAAARRAEELGFDGVWAGDHLACPAPVLDAPSCLAAAAAVTERLDLGLSVMLLALRQPAWAAKQLQTIDVLAPGRLRLGVGLGGEFPAEFAAVGVPVSERGRRVDATLAALGDLLEGRPARVGDLDVPALRPPVSAMPPVYVGGRGEAALRRAARFADAWLPMWLTPEALARRAQRLAELAQEHARPTPRLALLIGVRVDDDLAAARAEAGAHLRGLYGLDLSAVERWTSLGGAGAVAEHLAAHRDAGVGEIVLMPLGSAPLAQYERLAEVRALLGRCIAQEGAPA
jgi:alkanesulfonate monooxygenase SsuD/methylene tetrahydromethanopterin reductase-like flavin-dependent oxidoreductase (luciferase family)